ncbi:uncharacterized protein DS421_20g696990 [Arachis hypogaea]|nr:uncharacterized protein DS421_20g696990 [Arachis hypogaea]
MMAFAFFSFSGSLFHVTQHLFHRPGKATHYMMGVQVAIRCCSTRFPCCNVSWVPMMVAMKSFSFPYDGDMVKIFCQNMHRIFH